MILLDVNKYFILDHYAQLWKGQSLISLYMWLDLNIPCLITNFESRMTYLDILVKVAIWYKHLNMLNFTIITFIKYILHSILSCCLKFSVLFILGFHGGQRIQ